MVKIPNFAALLGWEALGLTNLSPNPVSKLMLNLATDNGETTSLVVIAISRLTRIYKG